MTGQNSVADFSTTPGANTTIGANDSGENNVMSGMNNIDRALAAALAGAFTLVDATGTDAYSAALIPATTATTTKMVYAVNFANANTSTATTLALNGASTQSLVSRSGAVLQPGQIHGFHWVALDGSGSCRVLNPSPLAAFLLSSGSGVVATGATGYIGIGVSNTTESQVQVPAAQAGTYRKLRVQASSAPGSGQTYLATLRQNGIGIALQCTISGASSSSASDLVNSLTVAAGDLLDLQIQSSAGAASASFAASLEILGA